MFVPFERSITLATSRSPNHLPIVCESKLRMVWMSLWRYKQVNSQRSSASPWYISSCFAKCSCNEWLAPAAYNSIVPCGFMIIERNQDDPSKTTQIHCIVSIEVVWCSRQRSVYGSWRMNGCRIRRWIAWWLKSCTKGWISIDVCLCNPLPWQCLSRVRVKAQDN